MIPVLAIANLPGNQCPSHDQLYNMTETEYHQLWTNKLTNIQGSIMIVGFSCFLFGCFGLMGRILHLTSPVIIGPTIIQLGLSLAKVSITEASKSWPFSILTIVLMLIFSQYISEVYFLFPKFAKNRINEDQNNRTRKSSNFSKIYLFRLFPVLCTIATVWTIAAISTFYNILPAGNEARVDGEKTSLIRDSPYFYV